MSMSVGQSLKTTFRKHRSRQVSCVGLCSKSVAQDQLGLRGTNHYMVSGREARLYRKIAELWFVYAGRR